MAQYAVPDSTVTGPASWNTTPLWQQVDNGINGGTADDSTHIEDSNFAGARGKEWKHIMHKGNSSGMPLQAPGIWIYPSTNKLAINMNTYNSVKESCDIGNIPLNKWFHLTVMVIGSPEL